MQHIHGPTINPKNSHKDLNGVLEINFTMLLKYIKVIPIKYAVKYIALQLNIITIVKNNNNNNNINHKNAYKTQLPSFTLLS